MQQARPRKEVEGCSFQTKLGVKSKEGGISGLSDQLKRPQTV